MRNAKKPVKEQQITNPAALPFHTSEYREIFTAEISSAKTASTERGYTGPPLFFFVSTPGAAGLPSISRSGLRRKSPPADGNGIVSSIDQMRKALSSNRGRDPREIPEQALNRSGVARKWPTFSRQTQCRLGSCHARERDRVSKWISGERRLPPSSLNPGTTW